MAIIKNSSTVIVNTFLFKIFPPSFITIDIFLIIIKVFCFNNNHNKTFFNLCKI
ncbi:hypothetical protein [Methanobrevibacter sp.]